MLKLRRSRRRRDDGISIVLMALLLVSMLGVSALVVDLGAWQVEASRIQQAADASSLAAVVRLVDGEVAATNRALDVAADNGYQHGVDGVTVDVQVLGDESLEVTITRNNVTQFFSQVVRGDPTTITRSSTAQYVQPVPLGSPRNYLGTDVLMADLGVGGDGIENFFLAVSGVCTRREYGDRIAVRSTRNGSTSPHNCTPGTASGSTTVLPNPEFDPDGYLFGVTIPDSLDGTQVAIQMFDPPVCTSRSSSDVIYGEQASPFSTVVTVRRFDDPDPLSGKQLSQRTFDGHSSTTGQCRFDTSDVLSTEDDNADLECSDSNRLRDCWFTLATVTQAGDYTIQVDPTFVDANTRHNVFGLRAFNANTGFAPCSADDTVPPGDTPSYDANCPEVYGLEHLPIYAQSSSATRAQFFLASIDARHNSKTMQVTFFDTAEGSEGLRLVNPTGGYESFTWEILCSDGSSAPCDPAENDPLGGRSGGPTSLLDVSGNVDSAFRTFGSNSQSGKYSDRLIRLTLKLPADIDAAYAGRTWWKVEYIAEDDGFDGDRTTWTVQLLGDPVRLLPNAAPTTTVAPGP